MEEKCWICDGELLTPREEELGMCSRCQSEHIAPDFDPEYPFTPHVGE